jgi:hypothetical protein
VGTVRFKPNLNNKAALAAIAFLPDTMNAVPYEKSVTQVLYGWRSAVKTLVSTAVSEFARDTFFGNHDALFPHSEFFIKLYGLTCFALIADPARGARRPIAAIVVSFADENNPSIVCDFVNKNADDDHSQHAEAQCCRFLDSKSVDVTRL